MLSKNHKLGNVWLPPGRHVLGARAARLLMPHFVSSQPIRFRRTLIRLNPFLNVYDDNAVAILLCRKSSVAFDTACYIKQVAKGHLKHNRFSAWRGMARPQLEKALTKGRGPAMRSSRGCNCYLLVQHFAGAC